MTMPAEPRRENVFTRKIGPLPMWGWVAIVAAVLLAWRWYSSKHGASQQGAAQQAATANASQVPQFVNQTYTTVQAPASPPVPPSSHPEGPGGPRRQPPSPSPPVRVQPPKVQGQKLSDAISALKASGATVTQINDQGIAGVRNAQFNVSASQYGNYPVVWAQPSGSNAYTLWVSG